MTAVPNCQKYKRFYKFQDAYFHPDNEQSSFTYL